MNITPRDIVPMKLFNLLFLSVILTYSGLARSESNPGDFSMFQSADTNWALLENGVTTDKINKVFNTHVGDSDTVWGRMSKAKNVFSRNCLKAFPHVEFCRCLGNKMPVFATIELYISVSTENDKLLNAYYGLPPLASINIKKARNECSKLVR